MDRGGTRYLFALDTVTDVKVLLSAIVAGFGPGFQQTLVTTRSGKVHFTNRGIQIMKALPSPSPVARIVLNAVETHYRATGDNTKSFIVLLEALINQTMLYAGTSQADLLSFSNDVNFVVNELLPPLFMNVHDLSLCSSGTIPIDWMDALMNLTGGSLNSHLLERDSAYISKLLVDWLKEWTKGFTLTVHDVVALLIQNFNMLCHKSTSELLSSSHMVSGVLISRGFCNCINKEGSSELLYVMLTCSVTPSYIDEQEIACYACQGDTPSSFDHHDVYIEHQMNAMSLFLQQLLNEGIQLILTTKKLSTYEKAQCMKHGLMSVDNIPTEELLFLAMLNGKEPLSRPQFFQRSCVCFASQCSQLVLNSQFYVKVSMIGTDGQNCSSLILASPTEGLAANIYQLVLDTLKCIKAAVVNKAAAAGTYQPGTLWSKDIVQSAVQEIYFAQEKLSLGSQDVEGHQSSSNQHLCVISVGGTFEVLLYRVIADYLCTNPEVRGKQVLKVLSEALLSVPRLIHANAYFYRKTLWISTLHSLCQKTEIPSGVNAVNGQACPLQLVHPFCNKTALIDSVLILLYQLLRLEMVG